MTVVFWKSYKSQVKDKQIYYGINEPYQSHTQAFQSAKTKPRQIIIHREVTFRQGMDNTLCNSNINNTAPALKVKNKS